MGLIILAIAGIGFYFEIFLIWVCLVELIYVSFLKKKKKTYSQPSSISVLTK